LIILNFFGLIAAWFKYCSNSLPNLSPR
jgi:hypothetical protein